MEKEVTWFKTNEFKIGLALLILSGIGTITYDAFNSNSTFTTLTDISSWTSRKVLTLLNVEIKMWILLIGFTLAIMSRIIFRGVKPTYTTAILDSSPKTQSFYKYTETNRKLKWRWSYNSESRFSNYGVVGLAAYCDSCDTRLTFTVNRDGAYLSATCIRCGKEYDGDQIDTEHEIKTIIDDDIRRIIESENLTAIKVGL